MEDVPRKRQFCKLLHFLYATLNHEHKNGPLQQAIYEIV